MESVIFKGIRCKQQWKSRQTYDNFIDTSLIMKHALFRFWTDHHHQQFYVGKWAKTVRTFSLKRTGGNKAKMMEERLTDAEAFGSGWRQRHYTAEYSCNVLASASFQPSVRSVYQVNYHPETTFWGCVKSNSNMYKVIWRCTKKKTKQIWKSLHHVTQMPRSWQTDTMSFLRLCNTYDPGSCGA